MITFVNPLPGWGHGWTRKMTPSNPIFHNEINALEDFRGGVKVARDFARIATEAESRRQLEQKLAVETESRQKAAAKLADETKSRRLAEEKKAADSLRQAELKAEAESEARRVTEVAIAVKSLNRMRKPGQANFVRVT